MDGVLIGVLAGGVIAFIVYKAVQMRKKKSSGGSGGGSAPSDLPQEEQNPQK